jgi:hypothetical protein
MSPTHHHGTMMPQETDFDNADQPGIAQPFSQTEIEELLFGDDRPAEERLARLREIRDEAAARESADWGDEDPAALLEEIDRAIEALSTDVQDADDTIDYANLSAPLERDPDEHLDALSPDDVDAREALEGDEDEEDLDVLDESEWEEGDDFRPERGVH